MAIFILAVPILIGVFFVSLAVAKNITVPIEEIAKGIKIISEKNLDYKVKIRSQDEIGDLAYHFNSHGDAAEIRIPADTENGKDRGMAGNGPEISA